MYSFKLYIKFSLKKKRKKNCISLKKFPSSNVLTRQGDKVFKKGYGKMEKMEKMEIGSLIWYGLGSIRELQVQLYMMS